MADINFTPTAACINCMRHVSLWINQDNVGTDWHRLPNVTRIQKTPNTQNAQTITVNGVAVAPCGANTKSWTYNVSIRDCTTHPIRGFMIDQDVFYIRAVNGEDIANDPQEVVQVRFDDQGWTLDDSVTTGQVTVLQLNALGEPRHTGYDVANIGAMPKSAAEVNQINALTIPHV